MSREKQKLECEMAEMLEIIEKAREIYANDITDHTENEYIREGLLDAGYRKQEWISVDEALPEVRQRVLLYSRHDGVNTGYRADEIGRFYVDKSYPYRPTHWMPLPEAPKMKGGAE